MHLCAKYRTCESPESEEGTKITHGCLKLVSAQLLYTLFLIIVTAPTSTPAIEGLSLFLF